MLGMRVSGHFGGSSPDSPIGGRAWETGLEAPPGVAIDPRPSGECHRHQDELPTRHGSRRRMSPRSQDYASANTHKTIHKRAGLGAVAQAYFTPKILRLLLLHKLRVVQGHAPVHVLGEGHHVRPLLALLPLRGRMVPVGALVAGDADEVVQSDVPRLKVELRLAHLSTGMLRRGGGGGGGIEAG